MRPCSTCDPSGLPLRSLSSLRLFLHAAAFRETTLSPHTDDMHAAHEVEQELAMERPQGSSQGSMNEKHMVEEGIVGADEYDFQTPDMYVFSP